MVPWLNSGEPPELPGAWAPRISAPRHRHLPSLLDPRWPQGLVEEGFRDEQAAHLKSLLVSCSSCDSHCRPVQAGAAPPWETWLCHSPCASPRAITMQRGTSSRERVLVQGVWVAPKSRTVRPRTLNCTCHVHRSPRPRRWSSLPQTEAEPSQVCGPSRPCCASTNTGQAEHPSGLPSTLR